MIKMAATKSQKTISEIEANVLHIESRNIFLQIQSAEAEHSRLLKQYDAVQAKLKRLYGEYSPPNFHINQTGI